MFRCLTSPGCILIGTTVTTCDFWGVFTLPKCKSWIEILQARHWWKFRRCKNPWPRNHELPSCRGNSTRKETPEDLRSRKGVCYKMLGIARSVWNIFGKQGMGAFSIHLFTLITVPCNLPLRILKLIIAYCPAAAWTQTHVFMRVHNWSFPGHGMSWMSYCIDIIMVWNVALVDLDQQHQWIIHYHTNHNVTRYSRLP